MKNINEKFTDEEYKRINNLKKLLGMTWHDLILKIVDLADVEIEQQLKKNKITQEEFNEYKKEVGIDVK